MSTFLKSITTRFENQSSKLIEYNLPSAHVSYYSISTGDTVIDTNFMSTYNVVGEHSGNVWKKYNNIPVYFSEPIQPTLENDSEKGSQKKLVGAIVIPKRNLDFIQPKIGDAIYFVSVPDDYKQRLFFITNVEDANINTITSYKLTISPYGGYTIGEIDQQVNEEKSFNSVTNHLIDSEQYKKIENFREVATHLLRLLNNKSKFNSLPYIYNLDNTNIYISDIFYCLRTYVIASMPKHWNNGYSLIFNRDTPKVHKSSFIKMLLDDSYSENEYNFHYEQQSDIYYKDLFDTLHPDHYYYGFITNTGMDIIVAMYQSEALNVHGALEQFLAFRNGETYDEDLITDTTLLNIMIRDYLRYKKFGLFPELKNYVFENQTNTLEIIFALKFLLEII